MCTHIHILYHAIQNKLINNVKFILNLLTNTYHLQNKNGSYDTYLKSITAK